MRTCPHPLHSPQPGEALPGSSQVESLAGPQRGCPETQRVGAAPQGAAQALTEVKGGAWVRWAEPDQGQQHEAGGQEHREQVEHQQEAKEGEVGLDSGAEEACGGTAGGAGALCRVWLVVAELEASSSTSDIHQGVLPPTKVRPSQCGGECGGVRGQEGCVGGVEGGDGKPKALLLFLNWTLRLQRGGGRRVQVLPPIS